LLASCHEALPYATGAIKPPPGNTCTNPQIIRMNTGNAQSGVATGKYFVTNDTWNASNYSGLAQTLYVCNYNNWYTVARMNNDSGDGAVKTSPNVQETWNPAPAKLSSWESVTSHFSDVPPGTGPNYGIWDFEYDIWLNGLADSRSTEIMIWTYDNGQAPGGSLTGSFTAAGRTYEVYRSAPPSQYIAFVDKSYALSGNVNLQDFFNYVISRGWMPASSRLYQICNGVELVSTNNRPEKFTINNFSIDMKPRQ
jgi:Glycosyl hydrolase family 12